MVNFISIFLNMDSYLETIVSSYGIWIYALLFLVVFLETGFVFTPFLPGDSLLFVAGALSAKSILNPYLLFIILTLASIAGDTVNYWVGASIGKKAFSYNIKFLNKNNLIRTEKFYEKYGAKTIIYARFIPIVRTFAPFVAGIGKMNYPKFLFYNSLGGTLWVAFFITAGYFFGNVSIIKNNLSIAILVIIIISIIPAIIEYLRHRKNK